MEESTYTYDDYRQDVMADEAARQYDEHQREVEAAGGVCADAGCYHNQPALDGELPF